MSLPQKPALMTIVYLTYHNKDVCADDTLFYRRILCNVRSTISLNQLTWSLIKLKCMTEVSRVSTCNDLANHIHRFDLSGISAVMADRTVAATSSGYTDNPLTVNALLILFFLGVAEDESEEVLLCCSNMTILLFNSVCICLSSF